MPEYIVELQPDCWLAPWAQDPCGRTLVKASAKRYKSEGAAERALRKARKYRPFAGAVVLPVEAPHD
jgi:hypothetical protein